MLEVKEVDYPGFMPPASASKVRYIVLGNKVFFTATEDCSKITSTINAAEQIIEAICKKEGLRWDKFSFYEIQTAIGYPWNGEDFLEVDALAIVDLNGRPSVDRWQRMTIPDKRQIIGSQTIALLANPVSSEP